MLVCTLTHPLHTTQASPKDAFAEWLTKHNKGYANDLEVSDECARICIACKMQLRPCGVRGGPWRVHASRAALVWRAAAPASLAAHTIACSTSLAGERQTLCSLAGQPRVCSRVQPAPQVSLGKLLAAVPWVFFPRGVGGFGSWWGGTTAASLAHARIPRARIPPSRHKARTAPAPATQPTHPPHQIGLNALADLSHAEFKQRYALGYGRFSHQRAGSAAAGGSFTHGALDAAQLPQAVDWREKRAVAEVKNQMSVRMRIYLIIMCIHVIFIYDQRAGVCSLGAARALWFQIFLNSQVGASRARLIFHPNFL